MTIISVCQTPASDGLWHMRPLAAAESGLAYPLLLAVDPEVEPLPAWRARIAGWLGPWPARAPQHDATQHGAPQHGAMTLRSAAGVIVSLILYRRTPDARLGSLLVVDLLRAIEPADGRHGLAATLRMAELTARAQGCGGILLRAEPGSGAWRHTSLGMRQLARTAGYARVGEDWLAELRPRA